MREINGTLHSKKDQEICALVSGILNMLHDAMPPTQKINRDDFLKLIRGRLDYLITNRKAWYDQLGETLQELIHTARGNEESDEFNLMVAVDNKIGDYIFEKYIVEKENLSVYQKLINIQEDPEIKSRLDEAVVIKTRTFQF